METGERVRKVRKEMGLTLEKFGARLGVSKMAISKVENGKNALSDQLCKSICREFDINENWLRTGEGTMHVSSDGDIVSQLSEKYYLDTFEEAIVREYLKLDPDTRTLFKNYLGNVAATVKRLSAYSEAMDRLSRKNSGPETTEENESGERSE